MWIWLKAFFGKLWTFIGPTVRVVSSAAVAEFLPVALDSVKAVAAYGIDNDEQKRDEAFKLISEAVKQKGKTLSTSVINLMIEMAVQEIKGN